MSPIPSFQITGAEKIQSIYPQWISCLPLSCKVLFYHATQNVLSKT